MNNTRTTLRAAFVPSCLLLSSCSGIGPQTIVPSRFDYTDAIANSWKQQMLINAVKMRYGDPPVFLEVSSVISQFTVATLVSWGGTYNNQASSDTKSLGATGNLADPITGAVSWGGAYGSPFLSSSQAFGAAANFGDRPTITYVPLSGEKFTRTLMKPIPPTAVLSLMEAGYPIDLVLRLCVHSVNGVRNRYGGAARAHAADPDFYPLLERLRRIQDSRAMGLRVSKGDETGGVMLIFRKSPDVTTMEDLNQVGKVLGLDPAVTEFRVAYGSMAKDAHEVALLTRSVLEIIIDTSSSIEVPEAHVEEKRVNPTMPADTLHGAPVPPLIRIQSSRLRPSDAYLAVPYRNHWFWIDDRELQSKSLFSFLMMVFSLNDTEPQKGAPIITIPS